MERNLPLHFSHFFWRTGQTNGVIRTEKEMLMKIRVFALLLAIAALFSGCAVGMERLDAAPNRVERLIDSSGNAVHDTCQHPTGAG